MLRLTEIRLGLEHTEAELRAAMLRALGIAEAELVAWHVRRRGYDARRSGEIVFVYTLDVEVRDEAALLAKASRAPAHRRAPDETYRYPVRAPTGLAKQPVVIGTGPCGIFAGLSLARMGFRPIILERGRIVRERTHDVWGFWRERRLNPESNVQFGEGGAGTFSDGKLHTGIKDRGYRIRQILKGLRGLRRAGGNHLYQQAAHRHAAAREGGREPAPQNRRAGRRDPLRGPGHGYRHRKWRGARGHARQRRTHRDRPRRARRRPQRARYLRDAARPGRAHRAKPFSIGFRIEHPQDQINRCRLGPRAGNPALGAADYKLVHHCTNGRSVYSFCMCPGGMGGGRGVGSRGRGHERHEPLLAQ